MDIKTKEYKEANMSWRVRRNTEGWLPNQRRRMNRVIKLRSVSISPSVEQERDAVFSNLRSRAWFRKDGERRGWGSNTNIRYVGIIQRTTQVTKKGHRSVFTLSSVVVSTTYRHCTPYWERRAYIHTSRNTASSRPPAGQQLLWLGSSKIEVKNDYHKQGYYDDATTKACTYIL